jgi:uncharacterized repeat protein (TIGR03803 family)
VQGGANNTGTIFRVSPLGTFQSIYSFGATGATNPIGELLQASDGNLYGTTMSGGANTQGTVFRFSPSSLAYADLYSFSETQMQRPVYLRGGFIQGRDGALYGTDTCAGSVLAISGAGPSCGPGALFKITTAGMASTLFSFPYAEFGPAPQAASPIDGLIQAGDGNFYGVTRDGAAASAIPLGNAPRAACTDYLTFECGAVFRMTPAGVVTILYAFTGEPDGAVPNGSLAIGPDGNLYGTTQRGGTADRGTVFKVALTAN